MLQLRHGAARLGQRQHLGNHHQHDGGVGCIGQQPTCFGKQLLAALQNIQRLPPALLLQLIRKRMTLAALLPERQRRLAQLLLLPLLGQQPLGPGAHHLRQLQQPQRVAGGGGVEDQMLETLLALLHHMTADGFQHGGFFSPRGGFGRLQVLAQSGQHFRSGVGRNGLFHRGEVLVHHPRRIQLQRRQVVVESPCRTGQLLLQHVTQTVGGIGGDHQHLAAQRRQPAGQAGGMGGLAHPALAAHEQQQPVLQ